MFNFDYTDAISKQNFEKEYSKEFLCNENLNIREYSNAIVLPNTKMNGGVYCNDEFIFNTSLHRTWVKNPAVNVKESLFLQDDVVFIGTFHDVWGHCITDDLKHLWFLLDSNFENLKELKFVYISVFENFKLPKNFLYILKKIGIKEEQLVRITEPTSFNKVYIPDECFFFDEKLCHYRYTQQYKKLMQHITKDIKADTSFEKVYFSRTLIKGHKDFGEKSIENYLLKLGYSIIHPQNYTFEQQVAILKGCKEFCTTEGSISHNVIFCNPNAKVIILRKDNQSINGYQTNLNIISGCDIVFINANKSVLLNKKMPFVGSFFLCVTNQMEQYFKYEAPLFDFTTFVFKFLPVQIARRILGK